MTEDEHKIEFTTDLIPKLLADKIKERMRRTGFSSVSSFVNCIL